MSSEQKESVEKLIQLLSRQDINLNQLANRVKAKTISKEEQRYLGLILGHLNKLFNSEIKLDSAAMLDAIGYENNIGPDALAEKLQPLFNVVTGKKSTSEQQTLLRNIEAISTIFSESTENSSQTTGNLSFVYQLVHVSEYKAKDQIRDTLMKYQLHLKAEIQAACPQKSSISIHDGKLSLMGEKKEPIKTEKMSPNLRLLVEKYQAISEALNVLDNPKSPTWAFRQHMEKITRPIIEKARTPTDNAFLNVLFKLLTKPIGFFSKSVATQGQKTAKTIEQTLNTPVTRTNGSP